MVFVLIIFFALSLKSNPYTYKTKIDRKSFVDIKKINADLLSYSIEIKESNNDEIVVKLISNQLNRKIRNPIIINQKDNILKIKEEKNNYLNIFSKNLIIIEIPKNQTLQYNLYSISGSIDHNAKSKDVLVADTVSGSIKTHNVGDSVLAQSVSGSIKMYSSFKEISAKSVSGSLSVLADANTNHIKLSSTSGSIRIQLENISKYNLNYSTVSGSVKDKYKDKSLEKSGLIIDNDQNLSIVASTISGSIIFENWKNVK